MARHKITFADHAWLRMDNPANWMVITGLMTFDAPLDVERLKTILETSLLTRFKRFRQRLTPALLPFMRPTWEDDLTFDLNQHLEVVKLPPPADQEALQELISVLMSTDLDYAHPLWHFYVVENYGKGSAFIARLHHCIADGISLVQVLLSLTEFYPSEQSPGIPLTDLARLAVNQGKGSTDQPAKTRLSTALKINPWHARDFLEEGIMLFSDREYARQRAHQGLDFAAAVSRLALRWPDPPTVFKGELGIEKRAAWSEPLNLQDVKFIRKAFQATVNDVLIAAAAGALGSYVNYRGKTADDLNIRSIIPVNLRPIELDEELGNKFGLVFLTLPLDIDDPVERLRQVKQNMDDLKESPEPVATFGILNLIGALPPSMEDLAIAFFDTKGTAVVTNVPGPQLQLHLAGAPINTLMAWVPQSGRIALGISIISYNNKVWLGVATDKSLVPDPETIVEFFNVEFEEMLRLAQKAPAEEQSAVQPMLSRLDQALQNLDELLAESHKSEAVAE